MGKLVTLIFAEHLIKQIEAREMSAMSFSIPDRFKATWFESIHENYEAKANDCTLDSDGLWVLNQPNHNKERVKFFWRIEPNYCTAGRPSYSTDKVVEIYKNSETRKSILKLANSEVCLEWFGFDGPTETCWGLRKKAIHITIYENGTRIACIEMERGWKKQLTDFINEYYKWNRDHK